MNHPAGVTSARRSCAARAERACSPPRASGPSTPSMTREQLALRHAEVRPQSAIADSPSRENVELRIVTPRAYPGVWSSSNGRKRGRSGGGSLHICVDHRCSCASGGRAGAPARARVLRPFDDGDIAPLSDTQLPPSRAKRQLHDG